MLELLKVAITGGVASGKTTVSRLFEGLGAYVVSADEIVHKLLDPQTDLGQKVIRMFGPKILQNGAIDRSRIAEIVFQDELKLRQLERIVHPAVLQHIREKYDFACKEKKSSLFVAEIPLLFETGWETYFDVVIAVIAEEEIARRRFEAAGNKPQEYERRMHRQLSSSEKSSRAHYTIKNNGALEELRSQVEALYRALTKEQ